MVLGRMERHNWHELLCKSMDWFLYDRDLRHERVNGNCKSRQVLTLVDYLF